MINEDGRKYTGRVVLAVFVIGLLALATFQGVKPVADTTVAGVSPLAPAGGAPARLVAGHGASDGGQPQAVAGASNGVLVGHSSKNDVSRPLRDMQPIHPNVFGPAIEAESRNEKIPLFGHQDVADPVVQRSHQAHAANSKAAPVAGVNFAGISNVSGQCGCLPPDTNGAAGLTQYVQNVNSAFQIFDKTGASLYGPANVNTVWSGFGGPCELNNDGDPVVVYDRIANRWLISQFSVITAPPYDECIAVSTSADATGSWNRYAFQLSTTVFPDYPKFGVWPDGYYMSVNQFNNGTTYAGPQPYVFDRTAMIAGQSATFQTLPPLGPNASPLMPADLDGNTLPPSGAPNYFVQFTSPPPFSLGVYRYHVDWTTPANSTFTNSANLAIAGFTELCPSTRNCLPQKGTTQKVDGIGDRLMFRLAYRNFGDHEAMVISHNVKANVGSGNQSGVRWYEIRDPGGVATIFQQSTYAPDTNSRWMGSAAMDQLGDIAVGYSVSSSTVYPSIRYASRAPSDAASILLDETSLADGAGFQTSTYARWGDYSDMTIDPSDDCTFWYTQEYYTAGSDRNWSTRISSFKFPACGGVTPTPTSTASATTTPTGTATSTATPLNTPTSVPATPTGTPTPPSGNVYLPLVVVVPQ